MTTAKEPPSESTGIKPTKYYCVKTRPDCNSQGLAQCDFCVWLVEQIKKARQEGIKEGRLKWPQSD